MAITKNEEKAKEKFIVFGKINHITKYASHLSNEKVLEKIKEISVTCKTPISIIAKLVLDNVITVINEPSARFITIDQDDND
jgi:hypothetical protein